MSSIEAVADLLATSSSNVAFTGAGMSIAAGVPMFRDGEDALWLDLEARQWAEWESFTKEGGLPEWYERFWRYYDIWEAAVPTQAHHALKDMVGAEVLEGVVTQNVESLDRRAGTPEDKLYEVHGNARSLGCMDPQCGFSVGTRDWLGHNDRSTIPRCDLDGNPLRPEALLYNEPQPRKTIVDRYWAGMQTMHAANVVLVIGTSATLLETRLDLGRIASRGDAVVIINPHPTEVDEVARLTVREKAEDALPAIRDLVT